MREHYDLQPALGHPRCKIAIAVHHGATKRTTGALNCERALAVRVPVREVSGQGLLVPSEEELGQLMIVDCIRIGWVRNPDVGSIFDGTNIRRRNASPLMKMHRAAIREP